MEITTWRQLDLHKKPVIILNVGGYWNHLLAMLDTVIAEGFMHHDHLDISRRWGRCGSWARI